MRGFFISKSFRISEKSGLNTKWTSELFCCKMIVKATSDCFKNTLIAIVFSTTSSRLSSISFKIKNFINV